MYWPSNSKINSIIIVVFTGVIIFPFFIRASCTPPFDIIAVNYRSVPVNFEDTVPYSPVSIHIRPFQKEQLRALLSNGTWTDWSDTYKYSDKVDVARNNITIPYTEDILVPEYYGISPTKYSDLDVTVSITLEQE